mmetsp:Transcript_9670/g.20852  ORF Transcript_9670/g.20852 Transcript_9670/m.20852 type:complete len:108 (+) Transcript_9670:94-417(+)
MRPCRRAGWAEPCYPFINGIPRFWCKMPPDISNGFTNNNNNSNKAEEEVDVLFSALLQGEMKSSTVVVVVTFLYSDESLQIRGNMALVYVRLIPAEKENPTKSKKAS